MTHYNSQLPMTSVYRSGAERVKVDAGPTSFLLGTQFRSFHELSFAASTTYVIRAVVTSPIILVDISLELDNGMVRLSTVAGGTPTGTFGAAVATFNANNMPLGPNKLLDPAPSQVLTAGATGLTGGVTRDIRRVKAATGKNLVQSVGSGEYSPRGVAPGTYYIKLESLNNEAVNGVIHIGWEERGIGQT